MCINRGKPQNYILSDKKLQKNSIILLILSLTTCKTILHIVQGYIQVWLCLWEREDVTTGTQ